MNESRLLNRRLPDKSERPALIVGSIVCWILLALMFRFASTREVVFTSIATGPWVLLLTYFAFGGDIPLKFRQKRYTRYMLVALVFWPSIVAAFIVDHFSHLSFG